MLRPAVQGVELPRTIWSLVIVGGEMGEELGDTEVLEAGGIVGHEVGLAGDMGDLVIVTVVALVEARHAAEVGPRAVEGHRAFVTTRDGGRVVG